MSRVVAPFQEGPAEEEDAVQGCSPPTRSHHRQRAMLAQVLGRGWLKELGLSEVDRILRALAARDSLGLVRRGVARPVAELWRVFHSLFAASKPRPAPAAGRGTVPRARLLGEFHLTWGGAAEPRTAPQDFPLRRVRAAY